LAINPKTSVTATDDNHRSVEFRVSIGEMEKVFEKNINEFRKQVSMKGFRPGQVPKQLFVSRFGDEVYGETVERIVQNDLKQEFEKIVDAWKTEEKLEIAAPAEPGELQAARGQELVYTLSIALNKPLIAQGYKDLGITVCASVVSEEEINDVIQGLRKRFAKGEPEKGEPELPELNDEFYAMFGAKDEADFKEKITDDILNEKKQKARYDALKEAFDKLIEKNPFPVLEEQIKYAAERSLQQHRHRHGYESDEEIKISEEDLNAMRPEIFRAIQEDRIIRSIIEQEGLKPTQAQVDARIEEIAKSARMDFASVKDAMRKNGQINSIRETLKTELAQNLLIGDVLPERTQEKE
jgi:FKBP-type peptidyl-prolyl cis-trans isomerase (trigger factor)